MHEAIALQEATNENNFCKTICRAFMTLKRYSSNIRKCIHDSADKNPKMVTLHRPIQLSITADRFRQN